MTQLPELPIPPFPEAVEMVISSRDVSGFHDVPASLNADLLDVEWQDRDCFVSMEGKRVVHWRPSESWAEFFIPEDRVASWGEYFRILIDRSQIEFVGGGTVHSSCVLVGNGACVFCGPSGVGKTTLWGFADPSCRFDDEASMLIPDPGGHWTSRGLHGTRSRIKALLFPRHAASPSLETSSCAAATYFLMSEKFTVLWHDRHPEEALRFCSELCESVPTYEFPFAKDASVLDWLHEKLQA
ncbi:MAG: hypothetical protein KAI66_25590 [Lentisphaeria bacterium]|nr:hypothetical protein [Lentisphaeria bacterium]